MKSMSWFLVSSSLGFFGESLVSSLVFLFMFFSSPNSVVIFGSLVFVSGVFGRSRVFVLSSSCPRVLQLHQVTSGSIAQGRGRSPAGHLQLMSLGPTFVTIEAFQLSHVHQSIHGGVLLGQSGLRPDAVRVLGPLGVHGLLQPPPLCGGWFPDGFLPSVVFCNVLHFVRVPGGVIAPSGLV